MKYNRSKRIIFFTQTLGCIMQVQMSVEHRYITKVIVHKQKILKVIDGIIIKFFFFQILLKKAEGDTTKAREILEQTMSVLFDKMKSHVDNGGKLNEYLWEEDEPCYGSDAYCEAYGC